MESPGGQQPVSGSKPRGQPGSGQLLVGPWEAKMRAFQPLEGRAHQGCHPALSGPTEAAQLSGLGAALGRHGCGHIGLGQGAGPVSAAFLLYLSLAWPHIQQACLLCGTWCPGVQDRRGAVGKAPCPQPGPVSSARPCPSSMAISTPRQLPLPDLGALKAKSLLGRGSRGPVRPLCHPLPTWLASWALSVCTSICSAACQLRTLPLAPSFMLPFSLVLFQS